MRSKNKKNNDDSDYDSINNRGEKVCRLGSVTRFDWSTCCFDFLGPQAHRKRS